MGSLESDSASADRRDSTDGKTSGAGGRVSSSDEGVSRAPPVIVRVKGVPSGQREAYRLSDDVRSKLSHRSKHLTTPEGRVDLILDWCRNRGRVSSTETADLTDLSRASANKILTELARKGYLEGSRPNRTGRGFHYTPTAWDD